MHVKRFGAERLSLSIIPRNVRSPTDRPGGDP
jgi:hypothetical protein